MKHFAFKSSQVLQRFFRAFRTRDCMAPVCFKVVEFPPQKMIYYPTITEHSVPAPLQHHIYMALWPEGLFGLASINIGQLHRCYTL